ncbi:anti-sigma regulatory factor [Desulfoscipio gibsoniae]|uniref:Anti-sigma regulatory factor (Ser/Thr protein kinase) n=1 Tax=Desulfoscipio gibsoniae DSM 7213 TaxID=767817 RepID=R4KC94_9FIRM|nr:anti-sigma regulatory factor [Desulfoscipio gibsoniae]AGL00189.1 anti-sigma regulatory factor (Ser/Thr protein kinase) [Desulfoscipio gibsoniae DSM 7213]
MESMQEINVYLKNDFDIVAARQAVRNVSKSMGFGLVDQTRITTAISELARNIVLYAGEGSIYLRVINNGLRKGIEILASDDGPGIVDIKLAMQDGYTTSRGLGTGLPGTKRLMDEFSIKSSLGEGTQVIVRKWLR